MDNETKNKIDSLERQVAELESWKNKKEKQQITFPLDLESINVLNNNFLSVVRSFNTLGAGGDEFTRLIIRQGNNGFTVLSDFPIYSFTANVSNVITIGPNLLNNEPNQLQNDMTVVLYTDGTLPSPLSSVITYYVVNASGNTCKLSLTLGGPAIDILDIGTGNHYIQRY